MSSFSHVLRRNTPLPAKEKMIASCSHLTCVITSMVCPGRHEYAPIQKRFFGDLKDKAVSATIIKTDYRLELKGCALLLADYLGIQPKAAKPSLCFAVPGMQEVRIHSACIMVLYR